MIERTFGYTYMVATKMRDDMTADRERGPLKWLIKVPRKLQDDLLVGHSR